jgi:hypothetical protein
MQWTDPGAIIWQLLQSALQTPYLPFSTPILYQNTLSLFAQSASAQADRGFDQAKTLFLFLLMLHQTILCTHARRFSY